ncbi:MAG TPA: hypothetical protein VN833_32080 [Candidatus Acidoferrales bacterium]|nr:hypothetical protein [Candidatus Acidoferrales bacterium]
MQVGLPLFAGMLALVSASFAQQPAAARPTSSSQSSSNQSSSNQHARKAVPGVESRLDAGSVSNGVYRNPGFGFTCKIPLGWVLRTQEMNAQKNEDAETDAGQTASEPAKSGRVLLAAFSRPPEARGEDVNSSILVAAESMAAYPGLQEAAQYFGPVSEVAKARGLELIEDPYELQIGTKTVVRGDFQRDVGTRVMRQSTLVILGHGYLVSLTFIGGTEDEVEELVQGLGFGAGAKTPAH